MSLILTKQCSFFFLVTIFCSVMLLAGSLLHLGDTESQSMGTAMMTVSGAFFSLQILVLGVQACREQQQQQQQVKGQPINI